MVCLSALFVGTPRGCNQRHLYLGFGSRETAYEEWDRDGNLIWNFSDPILNELREEPRFKELNQKLNI
ncbi:MAG: hypothetical protein ACOC2P_04040 [Spirochaetota bacterium]